MAKLSISDFKKNNFVLLFVVAVATLMFIFIPDFLGLSPNSTTSDSSFSLDLPNVRDGLEAVGVKKDVKKDVKKNLPKSDAGRVRYDSLSPLEEVNQLIKQGYVDYLVEKRVARQQNEAELIPVGMRAAEESSVEQFKRQQASSGDSAILFEDANAITWAELQSRESRRVFQNVRNQSSKILRQLSSNKTRSRDALLNYLSGIETVTGDGDELMTPSEAIQFLESLDQKVTRAFIEEKVARELFVAWSEASLSGATGTRRSTRLKKQLLPRFDPQATLEHVQFQSLGTHTGSFNPKAPVQVVLRFSLQGSDIRSVVLYKNKYETQRMIREPHARGLKIEYYSPPLETPANYTLEVKDVFGNVFHKKYPIRRAPVRVPWTYVPPRNLYVFEPAPRNSPNLEAMFASHSENRNPFALTAGSSKDSPISWSRF